MSGFYILRSVYYAEAKYNLPPHKIYFLSDTSSPNLRRMINKSRPKLEHILSSAPFFPMQLEIVQAAQQADQLLPLYPHLSAEDKVQLRQSMHTLQEDKSLCRNDLFTFCCYLLTPFLPYSLLTAIDMEHVSEADFLSVFASWVRQVQEHYQSKHFHQAQLPAMIHVGMFLDSTCLLTHNEQQGIGSVEEEERWRTFLQTQSPANIAANRALVYRLSKQIESYQRRNGIHVFLEDTVNSLLKEMDRSAMGSALTLIVQPDATFYLPEYNCTITPHSRLAATLYVLYIRHPEGIQRKSLSDHTEELQTIYQYFSPSKPLAEVAKKIHNLVEIHEDTHPADHYMSKLRAAFCEHLSSDIAEQYIPQGRRSEARRLSDMITFHLPTELHPGSSSD